MSNKKKLKRIEEIIRDAERGEFAVKGRDFGRGVSYIAKLVRKELDSE